MGSESNMVFCGSSQTVPKNALHLRMLQLLFYLWNFLPTQIGFTYAFVCMFTTRGVRRCFCVGAVPTALLLLCPTLMSHSVTFLFHSQCGCHLCRADFNYSTVPCLFWCCASSHSIAGFHLSTAMTICVGACSKQTLEGYEGNIFGGQTHARHLQRRGLCPYRCTVFGSIPVLPQE